MCAAVQHLSQWRGWFAWHPVRTLSGRLAWLKSVQRRWEPLKNFRAVWMDDPGDYEGGWQYRLSPANGVPASAKRLPGDVSDLMKGAQR
jgi:hypothetical protein